jgi:hypothetical protein
LNNSRQAQFPHVRMKQKVISNNMKLLLTVTALLEGTTGLGLVIMPSLLISILLGTSLTDPSAIIICRLTGGALITIAFACWLSRRDVQSSVMVKVMLGYNFFCIILLIYAVLAEGIYGPGLWPVVLLHLVLLIWCLSVLRNRVKYQR